MKRVQIGEVMRLERTRFDPDSLKYYRPLGVRSFGNGLIEYDETLGADLSKVTYFKLPKRALILSNIKAWEGAVAVSSPEHQGFVSSQRLLPYVPISEDEVDVRFIYHYFLSESGLAALGKASPGSADRNRTLGRVNFESIRTPLPGIDEQRAIAARLDSIIDCSSHVPVSGPELEALLDHREATVIAQAMAKHALPLSALAEINPRPVRMTGDSLIHFIPMADVHHITGTVAGKQLITRSDLGSGYKQFQRGDIIFARITPSMQNGKSAVFLGNLASIGYGSTEFHVIRPHEEKYTGALHTILRTKWFRTRAMKSFTGTAGQQRVPASHLNDSVIPDVSKDSTVALVLELREIDSTRREAKRLFDHRSAIAKALPQAARNAEFARLMS